MLPVDKANHNSTSLILHSQLKKEKRRARLPGAPWLYRLVLILFCIVVECCHAVELNLLEQLVGSSAALGGEAVG